MRSSANPCSSSFSVLLHPHFSSPEVSARRPCPCVVGPVFFSLLGRFVSGFSGHDKVGNAGCNSGKWKRDIDGSLVTSVSVQRCGRNNGQSISAEWQVGPVAGVKGKVTCTTLHNRQHSPGTSLAVFFSSSTHMWHKKPPWSCTSPALPVGPRTSLVAGGTRRLEQTRRLEDSKCEAGRPGPMQRPGLGRLRKGMPVYTWHRHGLDVSSRYPASVK